MTLRAISNLFSLFFYTLYIQISAFKYQHALSVNQLLVDNLEFYNYILSRNFYKYEVSSCLTLFKEAPYSWFSSKQFLYRSESSQDSRVETSRSGEILKKLYLSLFFNLYQSNSGCLFFSLVMRVWNLNIVLLNRFPDSFQWVLRISVQFDVLYNYIQIFRFVLLFCRL